MFGRGNGIKEFDIGNDNVQDNAPFLASLDAIKAEMSPLVPKRVLQ